MSTHHGKREKSASPAKRAGARTVDDDGDELLQSPPKNSAKRMFTGAKAMDEDFEPVEFDTESSTEGGEGGEDGAEESKEDKTTKG